MAIDGVLETCLYADDLDAAERFYAGVLVVRVRAGETLSVQMRPASAQPLDLILVRGN